jgi:tetrahydromethanopterin S-methyltransferase subunit B
MRGTIIAFLIFFLVQGLAAQETKKAKKTNPLTDGGSLEEQFQFLVTKTEKFQDYQIIRRSLIFKLESNIQDTLKTLQTEITSLNEKVSELNTSLDNLEAELKNTHEQLNTATKEKDSLKLFGILITKSAYYAIVVTVIVALIIALLVVFILYKRSNAITVKTKETLTTTQEEFERHRKWALEKEQKLARELLKEKQKNKGII